MRAVADTMGVTATALYRHFHDKDELVREMNREIGALFRDRLAPGLDRTDPWERLLGVILSARAFALDYPRYYELHFLTRNGHPSRYPDDFRPPRGELALLVDAIRACLDRGLLKPNDPVDLALDVTAHLHGLLRFWWMGRFGTDRDGFEAFADDSFARFFAGLAPTR